MRMGQNGATVIYLFLNTITNTNKYASFLSLYLSPQGSSMVSQSNLSRPASNRCKLTLFIYKKVTVQSPGEDI